MTKSSYFQRKSHPYTGHASQESFRQACYSVYHRQPGIKRVKTMDALAVGTIVWGIIGFGLIILTLVLLLRN